MITEKHQAPRPDPQAETTCCSPIDMPDVASSAVLDEVRVLSALADPTRLQIVTMLAGLDEPLCVCEIVPHFNLGQPTISHHLRVLREASLVVTEKRGLWVYYSLNRSVLERIVSSLGGLLSGSSATAILA